MKKYHRRLNVTIITQPLGMNYGGILQAYALQKVLSDLGNEVVTDNYIIKLKFIRETMSKTKRLIYVHVLRKKRPLVQSNSINSKYSLNTSKFIADNINTVDLRKGDRVISKHSVKAYDVIVVGSDQVWRKPYSNIPEYLLEFTKDLNIKRISYAASFGKDDLSEYGDKLIKKTSILAKKFDAVSVREDTGIFICKKYWGINAVQVVDPTLLLEKADYLELIESDADILKPSEGKIFTYILDKDINTQNIINHVAKTREQSVFDIMPPKPMSKKELKKDPDLFMLRPVAQWIKSFSDADFVITDSFHGCVFSIIFNKPFIAIGNKERGLTRFNSLLKTFGLEDRLVTNSTEVTPELLSDGIDWNRVNGKIKSEQKRSLDYLNKYLGKANSDE